VLQEGGSLWRGWGPVSLQKFRVLPMKIRLDIMRRIQLLTFQEVRIKILMIIPISFADKSPKS
jgi:hypothetical protein